MRFKSWIMILFISSVCFGGGFIWGKEMGNQPEEIVKNPPTESIETVLAADTEEPKMIEPEIMSSEKNEKSEYLLMLSGDSICVYSLLHDGSTSLIRSKEIDTDQLRIEDYQSLCRGITVDSIDKAIALCEDFGN